MRKGRSNKDAMAVQSPANTKTIQRSETSKRKLHKDIKAPFAFSLLFIDALLVALIVTCVPYTKIDWDAYMSQVAGFLQGERDYTNLKGDTGPLVYPAGFLYIYSAIQFVTGGHVYPAQVLFGVLYILNLGIILFIYLKTDVLPWWAFSLLCLSKRMHSIFVLRLFNDCFAMTLLHAALASLVCQKWHLGLIIFSGAVSVKMNVLLYAPPLLLLMLKAMNIAGVISALAGAALVQVLLGLPFLLSYPIPYISKAFNLGRVFIHFWHELDYSDTKMHILFATMMRLLLFNCNLLLCNPLYADELISVPHVVQDGYSGHTHNDLKWSVNFKFVPESVFVSKEFAVSLLIAHLMLLTVFAHYRWCKHEGGLLYFLHSKLVQMKGVVSNCSSLKQCFLNPALKPLKKKHIVTTMFVGNFIGILCARSLHYQFYSWYFYSLPYLLWRTPFPTLLRLILFAGVEFCWNVYPSSACSSVLLLCIHILILYGLWNAPDDYPYEEDKSSKETKGS